MNGTNLATSENPADAQIMSDYKAKMTLLDLVLDFHIPKRYITILSPIENVQSNNKSASCGKNKIVTLLHLDSCGHLFGL